MKPLIITIICFITLSSCSKQHKAESAVKHYLKAHLANPGTYEAIGFDKLRPHTQEGNGDETVSDTNQLKTVAKKQDSWMLGHAYKANNGSGSVRNYKRFILDMNCDSVITTY